jgi:hydrogenase maturation protein HypF
MVYKNEQAFRDLSGIADYFLTHNRDIRTRVDDSIVRVIAREPVFLRRARGYVPEPLPSPVQVHGVVACGGVLKSTVTIGRGESCYISPYIGKMENLETYASLEETTQHLLSLLQVKPTLLACDLHPAGLSTRFAGQIASLSGAPIEYVQHHHAHAAACMAENGLTAEEAAICVTYDGTGYGNDGTIWGGEIFIASYKEFKRVAHLTPLPMPGGELAIKHPWRMAWGALYSELQEAVSHYFPRIPVAEQKAVSNLIQADINCPRTSSMGRLFDALAALLGLCVTRHYEGQPAIILEGIADTNEQQEYPFSLSRNEHHLLVLDGSALLITALHDFHQGYPAPQVAARFHNTIARATTEMVKEIVRETGLSQVCLSGGCFQNALLLEKTVAFLQKTKLKVYKHRLVSPNDEGISYGQAIIAGARRKVSQERSNICV